MYPAFVMAYIPVEKIYGWKGRAVMAHRRAKVSGAPAYGEFLPGQVASFFHVAQDAYCRARGRQKTEQDLLGNPNEPAVALVFSVMSLEALIWLIDFLAGERQSSHAVADKMASKAGTRGKQNGPDYSGIRGLFRCLGDASGKPFDENASPWTEFSDLLELRHAMTHYKEYTGYCTRPRPGKSYVVTVNKQLPPNVSAIGKRYDLLPSWVGSWGLEWFQHLMSPKTERWACETASTMAIAALDRASFLDGLISHLKGQYDFVP